MALTAQQIRQMFSGGNMTPSTPNMDSIYGGVLPSMGGGNPALNAINAASSGAASTSPAWSAYDAGSGAPIGSSGSIRASRPPLLPGMVPGAMPTPRAPAGSPTSSGKPGLLDLLGGVFGGTTAGGLLKELSPDTFYGMGEGLKSGPGGLLQMLFGGNKLGAKALPMKPPGALTSAQKYALANSGPGSVAAMEAKHSGRPAGSYTDGREPSGTGSLW